MRNRLERAVLAGTLLAVLGPVALAAPVQAVPWWDINFASRHPLTVAVGANSPSGGYSGYTVRFTLNTLVLVTNGSMQASGNDLRILRLTGGTTWTELPRHVTDLSTATTGVRFMLQADVPASTSDTSYWLYYGHPGAGPPPAMTPTNVYRWWDDATSDREASYTQGKAFHGDWSPPGAGTGGTFAWNAAGHYSYDTGNDGGESMRPTGITERDIYFEYEFFQTGAHPNDMTSGPTVRFAAAGAPDVETVSAAYTYVIADSTSQAAAAYANHDQIHQNNLGTMVLTNGTLPPVQVATWTRTGIAAWGATPTNLSAWFDDSSTAGEIGGWSGPAPRISGTQAAGDTTAAGLAGVYLSQDIGRIRNVLIRRFTSPEPALTVGALETVPPQPPRFDDHEEGLFGDRCNCASTASGRGEAGWLLLGIVAAFLAAVSRRS